MPSYPAPSGQSSRALEDEEAANGSPGGDVAPTPSSRSKGRSRLTVGGTTMVAKRKKPGSGDLSSVHDAHADKRARLAEQETQAQPHGVEKAHQAELEPAIGSESSRAASPSSESELDVEELLRGWEGSLRTLRARVLTVPDADKQMAQDLDNSLIGAAFIRFIGPGDIHGLVNLDEDPNMRGNPRGLNDGHVQLIYDAVFRPNGKKDHEAPIVLAVPRSCVDPTLQAEMKTANVSNLLNPVPRFDLIRDTREEETVLETEIWTQRVGDRWLSASELDNRKIELRGYQAVATRCKLLNGNHRIKAMLRRAGELGEKRQAIRAKLEAGVGNSRDLKHANDELRQEIELHTWRCIVYDLDALTDSTLNYLVHNDHDRPALTMQSGERAWWLAQKFELEIDTEMRAGTEDHPVSRGEAANIVQTRWREELDLKMTMTGQDAEAEEPKSRRGKKIGDKAGDDLTS
ncbi:hypothetical protein FRC08_004529 [Ceratobasidium sp. 394]|nr:hypothetical protein FRC08_004529 [Ceratobasidium sp. 394]